MEGFCINLLFAFYGQCLIVSGVDYDFCGKSDKDFHPIYTLQECKVSSETSLETIMKKKNLTTEDDSNE